MRFAPQHRKPVIGDASFALSATAAVDKTVAIEAKSPLLVPSGFRQDLATQGRASAFRLRMAECELDHKELQRRAAIDLGLALLLGAREEQVTAKMQKLAEPPECRSVRSGGEHECYVARGVWNDSRKAKVSATELELEDTVSRGLASLPKTVDEPHSNVGVLLFRLAHKCGGSGVCFSRADNIDGAVRFVHWDRRDGGAHRDVKVSAATTQSNKRCKDATGWEGQEACLQACWSGGRSGADGATCHTRCLAFCDPH